MGQLRDQKIKRIRWRYEHGRLLYEDALNELIKLQMTRREAVKLVGKWIESWPRD